MNLHSDMQKQTQAQKEDSQNPMFSLSSRTWAQPGFHKYLVLHLEIATNDQLQIIFFLIEKTVMDF